MISGRACGDHRSTLSWREVVFLSLSIHSLLAWTILKDKDNWKDTGETLLCWPSAIVCEAILTGLPLHEVWLRVRDFLVGLAIHSKNGPSSLNHSCWARRPKRRLVTFGVRTRHSSANSGLWFGAARRLCAARTLGWWPCMHARQAGEWRCSWYVNSILLCVFAVVPGVLKVSSARKYHYFTIIPE